jgi:phosphate transport system substrate-binding protein
MGVFLRVAVVLAGLVCCTAASAQDVTLVSREGGIVLSGSLQGYDGEFYRISTSYGMLTVEGESVICEGPACPDLVAPRAEIRITGASDIGAALLEPLFRAFAADRGLIYEPMPADVLGRRPSGPGKPQGTGQHQLSTAGADARLCRAG